MKRLLALLLIPLAACVPMQEETRIERGPLLRSYDREVQLGNKTIQASVTPKWPNVEVAFARYDTCRTEKVEEYAEDRITERTSRGVGPAIALGICGTLAGTALLAGRGGFSNDPNTNVIDAAGRYGPSPRQVATGWGAGALVVGLPALAVGLIDYGRSGESTESAKGEQVISARDALCKPEPIEGTVEFLGGPGPNSLQTKGGVIVLSEEQLLQLGDFTANINGEPVFFTPADDARLNAFRACAQVLPAPPPESLATLGGGQLRTRLELLDSCDSVAPEAVGEGRRAYEAALAAVTRKERPSSSSIGPRLESIEDVMQVFPPTRRAADGTSDALALSRGELKPGEVLWLIGRVRSRNTVNAATVEKDGSTILVPLSEGEAKPGSVELDVAHVEVGNTTVVVLLEPGSVWDAAVRGGAELELIAVVRAAQDNQGKPIPFVEAVWARSAP